MSKSYYDGHGVAGTSLTRSLFLTQQASNRILDAIEWHQWIHKTSGTVLRFWSPDGAIPLLDLWEKQVLDAISSSSECQRTLAETLGESLILDFEGRSTDRFWLRVCKLAKVIDNPLAVSTNKTIWKCAERSPSWHKSSCIFYL